MDCQQMYKILIWKLAKCRKKILIIIKEPKEQNNQLSSQTKYY